MGKNILVFCVLLVTGCSSIQGVKNIDTVLVYKKFLTHGTPTRVNSAFIHPGFYKDAVDTHPSEWRLSKIDLETSLRTARVKRYLPQKMGGITFAGEFYIGNAKHFFLYFQSVKLIIDFTERKRYLLQDSLSFKN
ncbi:hypothetical protein [Pedobacter sp.]|uniref:hypothetical protein n=1 Tax=Pedobacter sp. TaxID=1411316 RepID=UPI002C418B5D|nr:hypothetical protein [Pedobacter sp.]HWW42441.1 hypothetical protein [Pedobacter sp.]